MMITVMKFVFGAFIAMGFLVVIGTAGADCDGKCMENALPMVDMIQYMLMGIALMVLGVFGFMKVSEYDY